MDILLSDDDWKKFQEYINRKPTKEEIIYVWEADIVFLKCSSKSVLKGFGITQDEKKRRIKEAENKIKMLKEDKSKCT